jgi:endonuclease YncB( thermonuclease family)
MMRVFILCALAMISSPANAKTWRVSVVEVLDGDTFVSDREVFGKRQSIRLLGVDTPEIDKAQCEAERTAGVAARDYLAAQIALAGGKATLRRVKLDKYGGRWNAQVWLSIGGKSVDVTALIVTQGHGRKYRGDARDPMSWCNGGGADLAGQ